MPLLGFKAQFADAVKHGEKCQTIRAYRKDGRDPRVGDTLYLWTGLRQKGARKLGEGIVERVTDIKLSRSRNMWLGDFDEYDDETEHCIAEADGFADPGDMFDWFEKTHGLPFRGLMIRWELTK